MSVLFGEGVRGLCEAAGTEDGEIGAGGFETDYAVRSVDGPARWIHPSTRTRLGYVVRIFVALYWSIRADGI